MDHKNPVSDIGDGVLYLDIMKKHANCPDCRFWQVSTTPVSTCTGLFNYYNVVLFVIS